LDLDESASSESELQQEESRFLVVESQVLLHHTAEALLRMYLAHESNPACPWLTMAASREPGKFTKQLAELAKTSWTQDRLSAVGWVFLGGVPDHPPEEWLANRDAAVRLIRILASQMSDDSQLYNSVKHGFTALGGTGSLHFLPADASDPNDGPPLLTVDRLERDAVLGAEGLNIAYLERAGTRKSGYTWSHRTRWLTPERDAYLTQLAIIQMEALWTVAKCRYLEAPPERIHLVTNEALDLWRDFPRGGPVQSWSIPVAHQQSNGPE
jgi:hypothetical protein